MNSQAENLAVSHCLLCSKCHPNPILLRLHEIRTFSGSYQQQGRKLLLFENCLAIRLASGKHNNQSNSSFAAHPFLLLHSGFEIVIFALFVGKISPWQKRSQPFFYISSNTPTVFYLGHKKQHLINRDYKINISFSEIGCFTINKCHSHCRGVQKPVYVFLIGIPALCITILFCCLVN